MVGISASYESKRIRRDCCSEMLRFFVNSVPGRLERIEGIDLLRFIDYNKKLCLHEVEECHTLSVDTEKDLEEVRKRMLFHIE